MRKCCFKGLCVGLLAVLLGTASCRAQEKVVYRDYDRLGWTILDSLKRPGAASLFKGMNTLNWLLVCWKRIRPWMWNLVLPGNEN